MVNYPESANRRDFDLGSDRCGNVAVVASLAMVPLLAFAGGAIELIRTTTMQTKLQSALDSSALAAAALTNSQDVQTAVNEYLSANLPDEEPWTSLVVTATESEVSINSKTVSISAEIEMSSVFLGLVGIEKSRVVAETLATQSATNVELSLVVDISSSMNGSKLDALQSASSEFVDRILVGNGIETTSINFVPFGGTVNIGDMFDDLAQPLATATLDPSEPDYQRGTQVPTHDFRFSDGDDCVEYTSDDFDLSVFPLGTRPQVPHFWKWNNFAPWCPVEQSAVILNTNDAGALKDRINEMVLSDGTGMDVGVLWGARALSPLWRGRIGGDFAERPVAYNDEETLKVLVLMTDGNITAQFRPDDYSIYNTHNNVSVNYDPVTSHVRIRGNNQNQQTILSSGNINSSVNSDSAVSYFKRVCDHLSDNNVQVYTIGFRIRENSLADQLLNYCASNSGNYYFVETLDIDSAFEAIATSVSSLRIAG